MVSIGVRAQISFEHLTTSDGLSQSSVFDLLQDQKGFMWFATTDGLCRYDGYTFRVFRSQPQQRTSLSGNNLSALYEDSHGTLWIGTRNQGLNRLRPDGETFDRQPVGEELAKATIRCFQEDALGNLWIGTSESGLYVLSPHQELRAFKPELTAPRINAVFRDPQNRLWFGLDGHLMLLDPVTRQHQLFALPPASQAAHQHNVINAIYQDQRGRLWVGTNGNGLFQFDYPNRRFERWLYDPAVYEKNNMIMHLAEDRHANLWVCTDYGIYFCPKGEISQRQHLLPGEATESTLSTHATKKMLCDQDGNVWVGTWEGGVNVAYAQPELISTFEYKPHNPLSLLAPKVAAVCTDSAGGTWLGSIKGLTYLSPQGSLRHFTVQNSAIADNDINCLLRTPGNRILISTWNAGFDLFDPALGTFRHFEKELGRSKSIRTFAPARDGTIWLSTQENQLFRLDEKKGTLTEVDLRFIPPAVRAMGFVSLLEDSYGNLWLGTYSSGLLCWNLKSGKVLHFVHKAHKPQSLPDNAISTLFEDSQRRLWVGTSNGGIGLYQPAQKQFAHYTTREGLPSNNIASLIDDKAGRLWISTNGGLSCLDPKTKSIQNFLESDGILGPEFISDACAKAPDGALLFGSMRGLTRFRPEELTRLRPAPPVYLTSLKLFNRPVSARDPQAPFRTDLATSPPITLHPSQSVVTLEWAGLAFQKNKNIHYAYLLEGFDTDWNYVGTTRSATYTNLDHGQYRFQVKASVGNDAWSTPLVVRVEVLPPWYKTWWAYLLYLSLFVGILLALRQTLLTRERLKADIRIRQIEADNIRALDEAKTGFFTNISHEFRTPLTLIITPLEKLLANTTLDERLAHQARLMYRNANRLLRLINQLLDLAKLESGSLTPDIAPHELVGFVERIVQSFEEWAETKGIQVLFKANFDAYEGYFDVDMLEKIVYNLLSNAFKFTPDQGEIRVTLTIQAPETVTLKVEDSGMGMAEEHQAHIFDRFYQINGENKPKKLGSGIGLALTRELVERLGGTIRVESHLQAGTTFTVVLPICSEAFPPEWLSESLPLASRASVNRLPMLPTSDYLEKSPAKSLPSVLVVEDNEELRQYLLETLTQHYHVFAAANGREGFAMAKKHLPDLIISDWLMDEMDGVELYQALRTDETTNHIPFILLTSRSARQSQLQALETGMDDFISKPFNLELLELKIKNLIQNRKVLREKFSRHFLLQPAEVHLLPADEQFVKKVTDVVEHHLDDPHFDVEKLEEALNLSRMQLYRKLKSITDFSGVEFIRYLRLQRARQLLSSQQYNVSEVAYQVGFNDPAYFSRCFKKQFGQSPQDTLGTRA
ncbi:two-component regulator propeller domain-containing protein [Rhabdobacter roseus]|nr:two-component regulator propeller domain-containing protein [Rhabdobacter roseus]